MPNEGVPGGSTLSRLNPRVFGFGLAGIGGGISPPLPFRFCVLFRPRQSFLIPLTDMIELDRSRVIGTPIVSSPVESILNRLRWWDGRGGESSTGGEFKVTGVCGRRGRGGAVSGGGRFAKSRRICSACMRMRDSAVIGALIPGISRKSASRGVSGNRGLWGMELGVWACVANGTAGQEGEFCVEDALPVGELFPLNNHTRSASCICAITRKRTLLPC